MFFFLLSSSIIAEAQRNLMCLGEKWVDRFLRGWLVYCYYIIPTNWTPFDIFSETETIFYVTSMNKLFVFVLSSVKLFDNIK